MAFTTAASIGTGIIGRSWAIVFARRFERVWLYDANPDVAAAARESIAASVQLLADAGALPDPAAMMSRIQVASSLVEAVSDAQYIQESAPEDVPIKEALFADIDRLAPLDAIVASSTSEYPLSAFSSRVAHRFRCLVVHPLNPPHLIPAVEVCPGPLTDPATVERTLAMMRTLGQAPVLVRQEVRGFIMNRLQLAVLRESLSLVARGVCTVADLDCAMQYGLARRWAVMGPFETNYLSTDRNYEYFLKAYGPTLKSIADDLCPSWNFDDELGRTVDQGLGDALGGESRAVTIERRDRNLAQLAAVRLRR